MFMMKYDFSVESGSWSAWEADGNGCSVTCGAGTRTEIRNCVYPNVDCPGDPCGDDDSRTVHCIEEPCEGTLAYMS